MAARKYFAFNPVKAQSIWNSFKILESVIERLLDYFVLGVPSYQLRFHELASSTTRERFFKDIRCLIECDQTMFAGYRSGKTGWGAAGKIIVFGILKRNGSIRFFPIEKSTKKKIVGLIRLHTKSGSLFNYHNDSS